MIAPSNGSIFRITGVLWGATGGFSLKRPVTRSFDVWFDLHLNKLLSKQSKRDWGRHPAHYDVTVMHACSNALYRYMFQQMSITRFVKKKNYQSNIALDTANSTIYSTVLFAVLCAVFFWSLFRTNPDSLCTCNTCLPKSKKPAQSGRCRYAWYNIRPSKTTK